MPKIWLPDGTLSNPAYVPYSLVDAKGDLLVASAADSVSRLAVGANGKALCADSTQTTGVKWTVPEGANIGQVVGSSVLDTRFVGAIAGAAPTTQSVTINTMRAYPVFIPRTLSFDRICFEQTTAGTAGSKCRAGVYRFTSDTDPTPGALVYDGGEFATDGSNGMKEATPGSPVQLTGPAWYYFVLLSGTAAPTVRALAVASVQMILGWPAAGGTSHNTGWTRAFTYAALPDPFGTPTIATGTPGIVGIRISA